MLKANCPNLTVMQLARIVNQLHRIAISHSGDCDALSPPGGMTVSQVATIGYLLLQDGTDVYQKDIEQFFKLRRSTVSSMLSTLEKKGILLRQPVPHDARLKKLVLTDFGRQLSSMASRIFFQTNELMIQGLAPEELESLSSILDKIETNLSKADI
ncbi:MAG: MarR family winged helix-turn-helix transcriptional regulator [Bacillota bacterium]|nr:MarR family winged helix-turn-helix transcriptional regulator [Bacillota bacterium]